MLGIELFGLLPRCRCRSTCAAAAVAALQTAPPRVWNRGPPPHRPLRCVMRAPLATAGALNSVVDSAVCGGVWEYRCAVRPVCSLRPGPAIKLTASATETGDAVCPQEMLQEMLTASATEPGLSQEMPFAPLHRVLFFVIVDYIDRVCGRAAVGHTALHSSTGYCSLLGGIFCSRLPARTARMRHTQGEPTYLTMLDQSPAV